MTLREEILHDIEEVPESSLQLLLQFVRFLRESPVIPAQQKKGQRNRPRLIGVLEGQGWVSDDFDEPMELVPESEIRALQEVVI